MCWLAGARSVDLLRNLVWLYIIGSLQLQEEQVDISSIKFQLSENTDDFWCIDGAADSIDP